MTSRDLQTEVQLYLKEYKRPWKLFSLFIGLSLLIYGSYYCRAIDWDIPISLIMAFLTYISAPWSLRVLMERQWRRLPAMAFATWFSVDGCYWLYWRYENPLALELMREASFPASLCLYGICGVIWLYQGSLKNLVLDAKGFQLWSKK